MRTPLVAALVAILSAPAALAASFEEMFPGVAEQMPEDLRPGLEAMDLKQGHTQIGAIASIDVPEGYYFLGPKDAAFVLTTLWGNPDASQTLGMLFPRDRSPVDGATWGAEITFDEIGYVSDEDAKGYDYDALLRDMQADTKEDNKWRDQNGYARVDLLGWAAEPHYDLESRKLYWAKRLKFADNEGETLNYNIRALGRKGVLVVNFIAGMGQFDDVEAAVPDVLTMVNFTDGNRYSDFDPKIDTVAAVGIGGLIAGKVLAKTGLLAMGLVFLKKFGVVLLLPLLGLKRLFSRRGKD